MLERTSENSIMDNMLCLELLAEFLVRFLLFAPLQAVISPGRLLCYMKGEKPPCATICFFDQQAAVPRHGRICKQSFVIICALSRAQSQRLTGRICDWIFGCAPKNSCVITPVRCKTQSTVRLTYFRLYLRTRTSCFVINSADTCKYMLRMKHVLFAQWMIMSNVQS